MQMREEITAAHDLSRANQMLVTASLKQNIYGHNGDWHDAIDNELIKMAMVTKRTR